MNKMWQILESHVSEHKTCLKEMEDYLDFHGWHFNKKMCDWAVSRMYKTVNGRKEYIQPIKKEQFEDWLHRFGYNVPFDYDMLYLANMCKADHFGSSINTDEHLVKFVLDIIQDPDAYPGMPFIRFYADCIGSGISIPWLDLI